MLGNWGRLLTATWRKWSADDGWIYAGAMAMFAALALGPLLVITLWFSEHLGNDGMVRHALAQIIDPFVGHGAVHAISSIVHADTSGHHAVLTLALAIAIGLFGGSRLFYALQRALHAIWGTREKHAANVGSTILAFVVAGVLAAAVVAGLTALIFGSALFANALHVAGMRGSIPGSVIRALAALIGALILTPVVAVLFRLLPGTELRWSDVWPGAIVTGAGFAIGQLAIGEYLAAVNLPWTYGSAASIVVVLLWLYYSSYLFLLGAEFTQVYARGRHGTR